MASNTPEAITAGSTVTLTCHIVDPGLFLDGIPDIYLLVKEGIEPVNNGDGKSISANLVAQHGDTLTYSASYTAPSTPTTVYYQFTQGGSVFADVANHITPEMYLPNYESGGVALKMIVTKAKQGLTINLNNIPKSADVVTAVVDIGGNHVQTYKFISGSDSTSLTMGVPAGTNYRVRVIASSNQSNTIFQTVVAGASTNHVSVQQNQLTTVSLTLKAPEILMASNTPEAITAGSTVTLTCHIVDPGLFLDGIPDIYLLVKEGIEPVNNGDGKSISANLVAQHGDTLTYSASYTAPSTPTTVYYQFTQGGSVFADVANHITPEMYLPNYESGGVALKMFIANSIPAIRTLVHNIPSSADSLIIIADSSNYRFRYSQPTNQTSAGFDLALPSSSNYRIRMVATKIINNKNYVLAGVDVDSISLGNDEIKSITLNLSKVQLIPDPNNPTVVDLDSTVTLQWRVIDPVQFFDSAGGMKMWLSKDIIPAQNGQGKSFSAKMINQREDTLDYRVNYTASDVTEMVYYQFGGINTDFGVVNSSQGISWFAPNYETGESPFRLNSIKPHSLLQLSLSQIPLYSNRVTAVIDSGKYSQEWTKSISQKSGLALNNIGLPYQNSHYRIRVISTAGPDTLPVVSASGWISDLKVNTEDTVKVSLALKRPVLVFQDSTNTTALQGGKYSVKGIVVDSTQILNHSIRMKMWHSFNEMPTDNFSGNSDNITVDKTSEDSVYYHYDFVLPNSSGTYYYHFGGLIDSSFALNGHIPYVFVPDYNQGDGPYKITVAKDTPLEAGINAPTTYRLYNNYPNPFNPTTTIKYDLPKAGNVDIRIYNYLGQLVSTLVSGYQKAGRYHIIWNADSFASGVYLCRMTAGNSFMKTTKLLLLK